MRLWEKQKKEENKKDKEGRNENGKESMEGPKKIEEEVLE